MRAFRQSPIRQIIGINDGVLTLGDTALRIYTRGGILLATLGVDRTPETSPQAHKPLAETSGLVAMDLLPQSCTLVCGGTSSRFTVMDLASATVTTPVDHGRPGISCIKVRGWRPGGCLVVTGPV